jgi:FkbM family methyltransferase
MAVTSTALVNTLGTWPVVGNLLRWYARRYEEGSVVQIQRGYAAGMKWKRYHRYVSGYWIGIYEMQIQQALVRELKNGETFYDIGANAGFFSVLAARLVGSVGRVFAFEPLPENIESLEAQFSINSLNQCQSVPKAISNCSGTVSLILGDNNSMGRLAAAGNTKSMKALMVESTTLDEFIQDNAPPNLIKMDIEGFETEALLGASKMLASSRSPKLLIELHGDDKAQQVEEILSGYGYRLADLAGNPLACGAVGHNHIMAYPPRACSGIA